VRIIFSACRRAAPHGRRPYCSAPHRPTAGSASAHFPRGSPPPEHRSSVSPHDPSYWPAGEESTARKPLIPGGEPCPQAGWWFTLAQSDSRRYFDKGEIMPVIKRSSFGDTYWQQTGDPKDDK
jgi:hypothetical protein